MTFLRKNTFLVFVVLCIAGFYLFTRHTKYPIQPADNHTSPSQSQQQISNINQVDAVATKTKTSRHVPLKIFTPDWGIASTLVAMGHTPYAMGEKEQYREWASNPPLPKSTQDVGLRFFPNMEMLKSLNPDMIIDIDFYALLRPLYNQNIPIVTVNLGRERADMLAAPKWQDFDPSLHTISQQINPAYSDAQHSRFVDNYVSERKVRIQKAGQRIRHVLGNNKQFAVVSIQDIRSISFTTPNSMIALSMQTMGLDITYRGIPLEWGTSQTPIKEILNLPENTCLIIKRPVTPFFENQIKQSAIWQASHFSQPDACVYIVDSVWSTAGVEAAVYFAEQMADAIENNDKLKLTTHTNNEKLKSNT